MNDILLLVVYEAMIKPGSTNIYPKTVGYQLVLDCFESVFPESY